MDHICSIPKKNRSAVGAFVVHHLFDWKTIDLGEENFESYDLVFHLGVSKFPLCVHFWLCQCKALVIALDPL